MLTDMSALSLPLLLAVLIPGSESCFATPGTGTPSTPTKPCKSCAANTIAVTQVGAGSKPMDMDVIDRTTGNCATRTFTCLGPVDGFPNIEINKGQGVVNDGDDGKVDGAAHFTVTCNAAGTGWETQGVPITQVECAVG